MKLCGNFIPGKPELSWLYAPLRNFHLTERGPICDAVSRFSLIHPKLSQETVLHISQGKKKKTLCFWYWSCKQDMSSEESFRGAGRQIYWWPKPGFLSMSYANSCWLKLRVYNTDIKVASIFSSRSLQQRRLAHLPKKLNWSFNLFFPSILYTWPSKGLPNSRKSKK